MKTWIVSLLASLVALAVFATPAAACDGYRRVEQKQKRYESLTLTDQQKEQIARAERAFMEIVYKIKLNSIQLNSLEKLDHVIVGSNKNTSFADKGLL